MFFSRTHRLPLLSATALLLAGLTAAMFGFSGHTASTASAMMIEANTMGGGSPVGCNPVEPPSTVDLYPFNATCEPDCGIELEIPHVSMAETIAYHGECEIWDSTGQCSWNIFYARFTLYDCDNEQMDVDGWVRGVDASGNFVAVTPIINGAATTFCLFDYQWNQIETWIIVPDSGPCSVKSVEFEIGCCECPNEPGPPQC